MQEAPKFIVEVELTKQQLSAINKLKPLNSRKKPKTIRRSKLKNLIKAEILKQAKERDKANRRYLALAKLKKKL
ncbi:hypothetical protein OAP99_02670 [Flavobacteriaceae bacterium]|nr:hypothetical protein [Flavobacteriaceae bacterium]